MIADVALLVVVGLLVYALLVVFAAEYGRRTSWQVPEGTATNDWALRQRVGWTLGALATLACAVGCALIIHDWLPRALIVAQAAVMAAAGASDLRRFHLPLPLQMLGIALAVVSLGLLNTSPLVLVFALCWSVVIISLHAVLSRGSMQLGDHIATVWIALAMPFNGLVAVMLGDFANVIFARVKGMSGKKVAAAGSWLIFASAILSLPPYLAWFSALNGDGSTSQQGGGDSPVAVAVQSNGGNTADVARDITTLRAQVSLLDIAGDQTASVALSDTRTGRITRAKEVSQSVAAIAGYSQLAGTDVATIESLLQLSRALAAYDTAGVRASTARIATARAQLSESLAQATQVAQTSVTSQTLQSTQSSQSLQSTQSSIVVRDSSEPHHHSSKE